MGKVISFCSPMHGTSTTANLMAVGICLAADYGKSVLLMQTHFTLNNMELPLIGDVTKTNEDLFYQNTGLDAVIRLYKSGKLTEDTVRNAVVNIGDTGHLAVLAGTKQQVKETYDNARDNGVIEVVIRELKKYYDYVLIDTNAGFSEQTRSAMNQSDAVVFNLRQNRKEVETLLENDEVKGILEAGGKKRQAFYLFGSHSEDSKYNLQNMRRAFGAIKRSNSGAIGFSPMYMDAFSDLCVYSRLMAVSDQARTIEKQEPDEWWSQVTAFAGLIDG
jgi:septum formation inhibitor-activating ATPase MinD